MALFEEGQYLCNPLYIGAVDGVIRVLSLLRVLVEPGASTELACG
jgi:hypothetical protein